MGRHLKLRGNKIRIAERILHFKRREGVSVTTSSSLGKSKPAGRFRQLEERETDSKKTEGEAKKSTSEVSPVRSEKGGEREGGGEGGCISRA